ncbi:MAG: 2-oxo acid dehydrogenase subunit E2 [Anaerolineae bacterium]
MATQVFMPKLGMAMKEGLIGKWVKDDGAAVNADETIAVIITKKITYELKAPTAGILRHAARFQETRPVGSIIGFILAPGEAMPDIEGGAVPPDQLTVTQLPKAGVASTERKRNGDSAPHSAAPPQPVEGGFVVASPAARRLAREAGLDLALITGSGPNGRVTEEDVRAYLAGRAQVSITSAARRLAEEYLLDITQIAGSGPGGRITEDDVQRHIAAAEEKPIESAPPTAPTSKSVPFTGMRAMIAENMVNSLHTMAQVTMATEVDVTELVELRERLKKDFEVTYTDLIVKAVALALKKHPRLNATLVDDQIQLLDDIHIGVGVALDEGLIVPVIRHTDRLSVAEIGAKLRDLGAKARSNTLAIDEVTGGTFTISNLGNYGIDLFTPVINPPEVAILGVGRIVEKIVVYRGEAAKRRMLGLSLTFDHRVVDGAPAAAFVQTLADLLSHPYFLGGAA